MTENQATWMVLGFAALGISAAVIAIIQILRLPKEKRFRLERQKSVHEQLSSLPIHLEAVLIKGDKQRWLFIWSPVIFIVMVMVAFTLYLQMIERPQCENLMGFNVAYLAIVQLAYAFPVLIFLVTIYLGYIGIKSLRSGYYPPVSFVQYSDTIAKKGKLSTLQGILNLLAPLFGVFILIQGHNSFIQLTGNKTYSEIHKQFEAGCR